MTFPFLNRTRVGTPLTWYLAATCGFLSTSILMIVAVSPTRCLTSSNIGACIWHGPHHVAKKSTRTGLSLLISSLNVLMRSWVMCLTVSSYLYFTKITQKPFFGLYEQGFNLT